MPYDYLVEDKFVEWKQVYFNN